MLTTPPLRIERKEPGPLVEPRRRVAYSQYLHGGKLRLYTGCLRNFSLP